MLRLVLAAFILATIGLHQPIGAHAQGRVALVVGNSAYQHTTELINPKNDAGDMTAALKALGFDVVEALDADKAKLDSALRSFAEKLGSADVALFYYAGHGLQVGAQNYLVPVDAKLARERDLAFEAMRVDFVLRQMEIDREGKTSIVILDACRDNPLSRNLARSMGTRSTAIGRGLAPTATGLGTFIAYATQPGNVAQDGRGRNSPFTTALLKHMPAKGRTLYSTMIEVRKEVVAATDGEQVPWDHSALTGDFYFVPGDVAQAQGSVTPAPAASSDDVTALKERLRKLEEQAKAREVQSAAPPGAMIAADGIRLAELRARAANLDDMVKDLQKRLSRNHIDQGRAKSEAEREKLRRDIPNIMMEMTRRNMDLQKMKAEIAELEGKATGSGAGRNDSNDASPPRGNDDAAATKTARVNDAPTGAAIPPVTPAPDPNASAADFSADDNVRLEGTEIRSFRAPNPDACRNTCADEQACVGYQHGRKIPVMGTCTLYSAVTARHEDKSWRSGMRGAAGGEAGSDAVPLRLKLPKNAVATTRGFHTVKGMTVEGEVEKWAQADGIAGCVVACTNTPGCKGATYLPVNAAIPPPSPAHTCLVLRKVTRFGSAPGATTILHPDLIER